MVATESLSRSAEADSGTEDFHGSSEGIVNDDFKSNFIKCATRTRASTLSVLPLSSSTTKKVSSVSPSATSSLALNKQDRSSGSRPGSAGLAPPKAKTKSLPADSRVPVAQAAIKRSGFISPPSSPSLVSCFVEDSKQTRPQRNLARIRSTQPRRPATASGALEGRFLRDMKQSDASVSRVGASHSPNKTKKSPKKSDIENSHFSTADRTIFEELKYSLFARDSQFVMKGGKKHHAQSAKEVPFPRSYERIVLDHEAWEVLFCQQLNKDVSFHKFERPPTKVLDLGCGSGAWILNTARVWKTTHFVGLDIVPLHPDLQCIGSTDLANRITWIQANFLESLPFANEEFDFVMIKRISRGVPEDKWDALLEEIVRVMKPGGAIEIIEEDLFFPGSMSDPLIIASGSVREPVVNTNAASLEPSPPDSSADISSAATTPRVTPSTSPRHSMVNLSSPHASFPLPPFPAVPLDTVDSSKKKWFPASLQNSTGASSTSNLPRQNRTSDPSSDARAKLSAKSVDALSLVSPTNDSQNGVSSDSEISPASPPSPRLLEVPSPPRSSFAQAAAQISSASSRLASLPKRSLSTVRSGRKSSERSPDHQTITPRNSSRSIATTTSLSDPLLTGNPLPFAITYSPLSAISVPKWSSSPAIRSTKSDGATNKSPVNKPTTPETSITRSKGAMVHASPQQLYDPRDHSLLERIYREMHEARFINLTPLALIANLLNYYFKDVRSHAPISFAFPPTPRRQKKKAPKSTIHDPWSDREDDADEHIVSFDDGENASGKALDNGASATDSSLAPRSKQFSRRRASSAEREKELASQYIIVDNARSPATPRSRPSARDGKDATVGSALRSSDQPIDAKVLNIAKARARILTQANTNTLPNQTLDFDLRSLHLHLSTRVHETIACSESMWEWVEQEQRQWKSRQVNGVASGRFPGEEEDPQMKIIREMTRAEFDTRLSRFEMDMHDNIALDYALEHYLKWRMTLVTPQGNDRREFDTACTRWDNRNARNPSNGEEIVHQAISATSSAPEATSQSPSAGNLRVLGEGRRGSNATAHSQSSTISTSTTSTESDHQINMRLSRSFRVFAAWKPSGRD